MKTVAAKEAKNRFGQLIDDAQRGPVTIEKNGRPFAVVQSYEDFQESEKAKIEVLQGAIREARELYDQGRAKPLDRSALESIKKQGRQILSERTTNHS